MIKKKNNNQRLFACVVYERVLYYLTIIIYVVYTRLVPYSVRVFVILHYLIKTVPIICFIKSYKFPLHATLIKKKKKLFSYI